MFGMNWKKIVILVPLLFVFLISTFSYEVSFAQKKEYPEKAIKLVVVTQPGGLTDLGTRAWSDEFSKRLGVPVVILNQGGGAGTLATADASKAKPDGYTLLSGSQTPLIIGPTINPNLPYNSMKDFIPIGTYGITPTLIVVNSSSPFKTIEEILDHAKKNPGKLNCGSAGIGTISQFDLELVKFYKKLDIVHVPFKGAAAAVTALLGNHVDLLFVVYPPLPGHLKAGRLRGLATTSKIKEFPDIPLFSEKGLAQAGMATWVGLFAPAKIPKNVHMKLVNTFREVANDPGVIQKMEAVGFAPYYFGPDAVAKLMKEELVIASEIAKKAEIKGE